MIEPSPAARAISPPSPWMFACAWIGALLFAVSIGYFLYAYLVRFGWPAPRGPVVLPVLVDVALFSAFALHHSLFARTRLKAALSRAIPGVLERTVYAWIASTLFIVTCWLWRPVPGVFYLLPRSSEWVGFAAQIAGIAVTIAGSGAVGVLDLAGIRALHLARSNREAKHVPLVTTGVYTIVRHPLYFGWALLVFGAPHMTATRLVFASVSTAYLAIALVWEERSLIDTFGAEYASYQKRVRWRMLPGIY